MICSMMILVAKRYGEQMKDNIFISLPYGMSIRDILGDDFIENVTSRYNIVLFSSACKDKESRDYLEGQGVYKAIPYYESRLSSLFLYLVATLKTVQLMKNKKMLSLETITKRIKCKCSNKIFEYYRFLINPVFKILSVSPVRNIISWCSYFFVTILSVRYIVYYFKYKPVIFFTAHPFASDDRPLEMWARIFGLKTIASIHSWDNPTTKLSLHFKYNKIVLWNEIMKKQIVDIYEYDTDEVKVVGVPQFDYYFNFTPLDKEVFFNDHGLDVNKKLMVYFVGHPEFVKNSMQIVEALSNIVRERDSDVQLWIRVHPGIEESWYKEIECSDNIVLDIPGHLYTPCVVNKIDSHDDEQSKVANLLYHCDITLNSFSTTTLDAVYFKKPVINLAIEDSVVVKDTCSISTFYYLWDHYLNIANSGGVIIVKDCHELSEVIDHYIKDGDIYLDGRTKIFEEQIQFADGMSKYRIASELE